MNAHVPPPPSRPAMAVVIPTRNEAHNVGRLLGRLESAVPAGLPTEVLFVDDSSDGTPQVIRAAAGRCRLAVAVHHRDRPDGGLAGAVLEGIDRTTAPWIVVMDADLQHPPELAHPLVRHGDVSGADLVVASRYTAGGSSAGFADGRRTMLSRSATWLVKSLFPRALRGISDPMSGFFALRRDLVSPPAGASPPLRPLGYKILLELAVRGRPRTVAELPYTFAERHLGTSKSGLREGTRFLRHVLLLRTTSAWSRITVLGLIGLSGFLPNLGVLALLTALTPLHYLAAEAVATQAAVVWNFVLAEALLPSEDVRRPRWRRRFLTFAALGNTDLLARLFLTGLLVNDGALTPVTATAVVLLVAVLVRLTLLERLLYRRGTGRARPSGPSPSASNGQTRSAAISTYWKDPS